MQKAMKPLNLSKIRHWTDETWHEEFVYLCDNAPIHSLVITIEPSVAKKLLKFNTMNRALSEKNASRLIDEKDGFVVTGDTIKFSLEGALLDGQHRLEWSARTNTPITTHAVFGLDPELFSLLDQHRKRTAGDVLTIAKVKNPFYMAAACRYVDSLHRWATGRLIEARSTPRKVLVQATGDYALIQEHMADAMAIGNLFRYPPSLLAAVFYVAREKSGLATVHKFAEAWATGDRQGRNKVFDHLTWRVRHIRDQNGTLPRRRLAALVITAYNYWAADLEGDRTKIDWRPGDAFPEIGVRGRWKKLAGSLEEIERRRNVILANRERSRKNYQRRKTEALVTA